MTMKLTYKSDYKSIKQFQEKEIEDFSVFTGLNGSGKTHLLEAIKEGKVAVDGYMNSDRIIYFNFSHFLLLGQDSTDSNHIKAMQNNAWVFLENQRENIRNFDLQIEDCLQDDASSFYWATGNDMKKGKSMNFASSLSDLFKFIDINGRNLGEDIHSLLKSTLLSANKPLSEISKQEFLDSISFAHADYRLRNDLSAIFMNHWQKIVRAKAGNKMELKEKLEEESPWKLLNDIFQAFGLPHQVNNPEFELEDYFLEQNFSFAVRLTVSGAEFRFEDLSSGEKILCFLAITVFQQSTSTFPNLILLDEIDATLHPSMIEKMIGVIKNVFVKRGAKVILATHSPTMIARVDEGSIYEIKPHNIQKDTQDKIVKIGKSEALNILTDGFATLEQGITFLDSLARKELVIFTEGYNTQYIEKAIQLLAPELVEKLEVVRGIEDYSGETQLKMFFELFTRL